MTSQDPKNTQKLDQLLSEVMARPPRLEAHRSQINQLLGRPGHGALGDVLEQRYGALHDDLPDADGSVPYGVYPVIPNLQGVAYSAEIIPPEERCRSAATCLTEAIPSPSWQRQTTFISKSVAAYVSEPGDYVFSSFARTPLLFQQAEDGRRVLRELSARDFDVIYANGGQRLWREPMRTVEHGLLIHDKFSSHNYCHWLLDWLPRIFPIEQLGVDMARLHVILPQQPTGFQRRALNLMGFTDDRILHLLEKGTNSPVRIRRFYGTSLTHSSFQHALHNGAPWARDYLRAKFPGPETSALPARIIVDRRTSRRLVFDEATLQHLTRLGFVMVQLESMSFDQQIELFSGARCVIGAHGAGLANIVFCREGSHILEIFPGDVHTEAYWRVASAGRMNYACAVGKRSETVGGVTMTPSHRRDYDIDVDASVIEAWLDFALA